MDIVIGFGDAHFAGCLSTGSFGREPTPRLAVRWSAGVDGVLIPDRLGKTYMFGFKDEVLWVLVMLDPKLALRWSKEGFDGALFTDRRGKILRLVDRYTLFGFKDEPTVGSTVLD